jgi:hypothetical protein
VTVRRFQDVGRGGLVFLAVGRAFPTTPPKMGAHQPGVLHTNCRAILALRRRNADLVLRRVPIITVSQFILRRRVAHGVRFAGRRHGRDHDHDKRRGDAVDADRWRPECGLYRVQWPNQVITGAVLRLRSVQKNLYAASAPFDII